LLEKCGIKSGVLAKAEHDNRLIFNRTGRPMPALGAPPVTAASLAAASANATNAPAPAPAPAAPDSSMLVPARSASTAKLNKAPSQAPGKLAASMSATGTTISSLGSPDQSSPDPGRQQSMGAKGLSKSLSKGASGLDLPKEPPVVEPLNQVDVDMLAERFDVTGMVYHRHFMQYFSELHAALSLSRRKHTVLPVAALATEESPFMVSSEWSALKSSAVLKKYSLEPPAPKAPTPTPAPVVALPAPAPAPAPKPTPAPLVKAESKKPAPAPPAEAKDSKPTPAPPAPAPAPAKDEGQEKPPGVDVVEPSKGFLCCGMGGARSSRNQPEVLAPPMAEEKTAWVDPSEPYMEKAAAAESEEEEEEEEEEEVIQPKADKEFSTPGKPKQMLAFQPRKVVRQEEVGEEGASREGLGGAGAGAGAQRGATRRNHFRRADPQQGGSGKAESDEEDDHNTSTRWKK
jgi:hypothetical protein